MTTPNTKPTQITDPTYISFSSDITPISITGLLAACTQVANEGVQTIYLMIATPGGGVDAGFNGYNVLRGLPPKIITHNVGNIDSIGNVLFLAGEERYACANATFMFHGVVWEIPGQARLQSKELDEITQAVTSSNNRIADTMEERAAFDSRDEIDQLFRQAQWKDAAFAKDKGIIHDIRDVTVPPGCAVHQLVFEG